MEIVISHRNGNDFEELVDVLESSNIFMYDKSGTYSNDKYKIIKQPDNTYDEGETYLTHIIENYDKLAEYTLFIQDGIKICISSLSNIKNTTTNMINSNRRVYFYDKLIYGNITQLNRVFVFETKSCKFESCYSYQR